MQENFDQLVASYNSLSLNDKKITLINEIKEMIAVYLYIAEVNDVSVELLKSKEILDIENKNCSEEDYVEALYVYVNILKEIMSSVLESKIMR